ncbi:MAG: hypothetical protein N2316_06430 [Spirochaetes bacterium]|nr:hypothetical protein [Spirochaetota bacterium]
MKKLLRYPYIVLVAFISIIIIVTIIFYTFFFPDGLWSGEYYHEPSDPLHNAVVLYYQNNQREAKRLLLEIAKNKKYTGGAYINYAMLLEKEGNYSEAEEYYVKAFRVGERISLLYLFALYARLEKALPQEIINAIKEISSLHNLYWIDVWKAEEKLKQKNFTDSYKYLEKAVESGLPNCGLFYVDPIYESIKNQPKFEELLKKAKKNALTHRQLEKAMEDEYVAYYRDKPTGMSRLLYRIFILNDKTTTTDIEKSLLEILQKEENVRDRAIALYRLARICAKRNDEQNAKKYLDMFKEIIEKDKSDKTGFVVRVKKLGEDLFNNDPFLKKLNMAF